MTQEESRPAEQCRVCEGSGRLVRTLERGEVSSDCGNCGGTGVLPARPAVEEGPRCEVCGRAEDDLWQTPAQAVIPTWGRHHDPAQHARFELADGVLEVLDCHPFAARPLVQEDALGRLERMARGLHAHHLRMNLGTSSCGICYDAGNPGETALNDGLDEPAPVARRYETAFREANEQLIARWVAVAEYTDALKRIKARAERVLAGELDVTAISVADYDVQVATRALATPFVIAPPADDPRDEDDDVREAAHWAELYLDDCQADYDREGTDFPTPREAYIAGFKRAAIERRRGVAVARCVDCSESALDAAFIRNLGEAEDMPPLEAGWPEMTAALDRIMARADKPATAVQAGGGDEGDEWTCVTCGHAWKRHWLACNACDPRDSNRVHPFKAYAAQAGGGLCTRCGFEQRAEKPCACAVLDRARDAESRLAAIIDRIGNARLVPWVVDGEEYRQRADGTVVRALVATPQGEKE